MFGVPGLDPFGLIHAALGLLALVLGLAVVLQRKGTRLHRGTGYAYVSAMLLLNATALAIYDLYGRFGPFHGAALISLATVAAALVPAITRRPKGKWLNLHAEIMCWSYVGLVSAFLAEVSVRLPGISIAAVNPTAQITVMRDDAGTVVPDVSIEVSDVDAMHACAVERGLDVVYPLTTEPWGVRRFFVADPNGKVLNILSHLPA